MKNAFPESANAYPVTALIAHDHALTRLGLTALIGETFGEANCLEVEDLESFLRAARHNPNAAFAFIALSLPGISNGVGLADVARRHPKLKLIVMRSEQEIDPAATLSIPNVYAVVAKTTPTSLTLAAIMDALAGRKSISLESRGGAGDKEPCLTPRQEEIHGLLSHGLSNKMIATTLGISEGTVKNHITEILRVLNVTNRTQAARHSFKR